MPLLMTPEQNVDELNLEILKDLELDNLKIFSEEKEKMTSDEVAEERE